MHCHDNLSQQTGRGNLTVKTCITQLRENTDCTLKESYKTLWSKEMTGKCMSLDGKLNAISK